jgi:hypothetical protein
MEYRDSPWIAKEDLSKTPEQKHQLSILGPLGEHASESSGAYPADESRGVDSSPA